MSNVIGLKCLMIISWHTKYMRHITQVFTPEGWWNVNGPISLKFSPGIYFMINYSH